MSAGGSEEPGEEQPTEGGPSGSREGQTQPPGGGGESAAPGEVYAPAGLSKVPPLLVSVPQTAEEEEADREEEEEDEDTDSMEGSGLYSLTDDAERESEGGGRQRVKERRASRKRNRLRGGGSNHSSSSDDDEDEEEQKDEDDDEAMEAWLKAELRELRGPVWQAVPSLRSREIGRDSQQFVRRVCGARGLVQRLELQGRLERHTGCVNTLHFNPSGTRLASGSDDLRVVIWDWAVRRAVLEFDSGHKSNVFQVGGVPVLGLEENFINTPLSTLDHLIIREVTMGTVLCRPSSCPTAATPRWPCAPATARSGWLSCPPLSAARTPRGWHSTKEQRTRSEVTTASPVAAVLQNPSDSPVCL